MAHSNLSAIRELQPSELSQLNALVSESFGYEAPHSFFDDFPVWKSDQAKRFGIFDGEKLVAHVGVRFTQMKVPGCSPVSVALVGAVATLESYRGRGLSTQLLNEVCRRADEAGCEWTLLWGSEHEFYGKFGFKLTGEEYQVPLASLESVPENIIPRIKRGWDDRIFSVLQTAEHGIELSHSDQAWVSNHRTVNWFVHDEPFAFAGFQRGLDLPHIVHEYGGDSKALSEIFSFILSQDYSAMVLGRKETLLSLGFKEEECFEEFLCLARPNPHRLGIEWPNAFWVSGLTAC